MEVEVQVKQNYVAKTLRLHLKVCDNFTASLEDGQGMTIAEQDDGYVPTFMPGNHYGDYVILDIDIATGKITNWRVDKQLLQQWINACNADKT